jgi:hypothetical protein
MNSLQTLRVPQLGKKFPEFYKIRNFITLIILFQQMHYTILVFTCPYIENCEHSTTPLRMAQEVPKHMQGEENTKIVLE